MKTNFRICLLLSVIVAVSFSFNRVCAQEGVSLWTNRYSGQGAGYLESAKAIAVYTNGNVFVTGQISSNGYADYATIAYTGAGIPLWTNLYRGLSGNSDDVANAIVVDANGNIFVTGGSYGTSGNPDYATIAYSSDGVPLWTNRYNGIGNNQDQATAIAVDTVGNVFVTGYSYSAGLYDSADYTTIKYSNTGIPQWTNRYNGPGNNRDEAVAIAVDTNGNVFVTGSSGGISSQFDYATIKYSNGGTALRTNRYNGAANSDDSASAIALDSNGNVFVTGRARGMDGSFDYATIKYSNAGISLWTNIYNGGDFYGNDDAALAIATDSTGNVFVTGSSGAGLSGSDYATIKYSNTGTPQWTNRYNGPANSSDSASCAAVDSKGNIFVAGSSAGIGSSSDYCLIQYSTTGVALTTNRYNSSDDRLLALALNCEGGVFVTGNSYANGSGYDYATVKYTFAPKPIPLIIEAINNHLVLSWTNAVFGLQSAPATGGIFTDIAGATSPYTNPTPSSQQFFRLKSN